MGEIPVSSDSPITAARQAPQNLKDSFVAELAIAVGWTVIYIRAGKSWTGLGGLAMKYHWAGAKAFHDLYAADLASHAILIAVLLPMGLAFIEWTWNWPVGSYALVMCAGCYAFLTLGWLAPISILAMPCLMWYATGRVNHAAFANITFVSLVMPFFVVMPLAFIF